jgi:hypothetical protein
MKNLTVTQKELIKNLERIFIDSNKSEKSSSSGLLDVGGILDEVNEDERYHNEVIEHNKSFKEMVRNEIDSNIKKVKSDFNKLGFNIERCEDSDYINIKHKTKVVEGYGYKVGLPGYINTINHYKKNEIETYKGDKKYISYSIRYRIVTGDSIDVSFKTFGEFVASDVLKKQLIKILRD